MNQLRRLDDLLQRSGTRICERAPVLRENVPQKRKQFFRRRFAQFRLRQTVRIRSMLPVPGVRNAALEHRGRIEFRIRTILQDTVDIRLVRLRIRFRIADEMFHQRDRFVQVRRRTRKFRGESVLVDRDRLFHAELVELLAQRIDGVAARSDVLQIINGKLNLPVFVRGNINDAFRMEKIRTGNRVHAFDGDSVRQFHARNILCDVNETRLNRGRRRKLEERAAVFRFLLRIQRNGRDFRLLNLDPVRRLTGRLVDADMMSEILLYEFRYILLGKCGNAVGRGEQFRIGIAIDKEVGELPGEIHVVTFADLRNRDAAVFRNRSDAPVTVFTLAELFEFRKQKRRNLVQRLSRTRRTVEHEKHVLASDAQMTSRSKQFLRAEEVLFEQTIAGIFEQTRNQRDKRAVARGAFHAPAKPCVRRLRSADGQFPVFGQRLFHRHFTFGNGCGFELAERLLRKRISLLEIKIADNRKRHIAGDIIAVEEGHDILHRRIFQVIRLADNRTSRGMGRQQRTVERLIRNHPVLVLPAVEFLINRLKFGVEQTEHRIREAFRIQFQIISEFVCGKLAHVDGEIDSGRGIESGGAEGRGELGELTRRGILRRLAGDAINFRVKLLLANRIRLHLPLFKKIGNTVEKRFFLCPVKCSHPRSSLEHHVLEIVGEPRGIGRFIGRTCADDGQHRNARTHRVARKIKGQTIRQFVDTCVERIVLNIRVRVSGSIFCGLHNSSSSRRQPGEDDESGNHKYRFHRYPFRFCRIRQRILQKGSLSAVRGKKKSADARSGGTASKGRESIRGKILIQPACSAGIRQCRTRQVP